MRYVEPANRPLLRQLLFVMCLSFLPSLVFAQGYIYNQAGLATAYNPSGLAVADFNGDGRLDVAFANSSDNTVSIVLSKANGTFASRINYHVGAAPVSLVSADFNGDGILDLAVVNSQDNTISILLGTGLGSFGSPTTFPVGATPIAIVVADFDSDTKLDLAVINQADGTVSVLLGNGDGTFAAQSTTAVASNPVAIVGGDFNSDGLPDLAVMNAQGSLSLLLNTGHGSFSVSSKAIVSSGGSITVGDFNSDGNMDLAVTDTTNNVILILLGDGTGVFQSLATPLSLPSITIAAGDFNNDGKLDLAVGAGNSYPSSILILLGNGDGTFQQPMPNAFTGPASAMLAADFNNDNYLDLAAVDVASNLVTILLGDGKGNIGPHSDFTLPASGGIAGSAAADFNGDGKVDAAVAQFNQNAQGITGFISVLPSNGDGTFQPPISTQVPNIGIDQMIAGDFRGDGKIDIATAGIPATGSISVVLGNGDGTFGTQIADPVNISGLATQYMTSGDFNNDGKEDLALFFRSCGNACSPLYVLLSNGDGTFNPFLVNNVPGLMNDLSAGDFNHDGNLDLAVAGQGLGSESIFVFLGHGDGTFSNPGSYSPGTLDTYTVTAADFDGDGNVDLAVGTDQGIFFFAGNGDGTFRTPVKTSTPSAISHAVLGDFNGDGKPDLAVTAPSGSAAIVLGNGDGTFQAPVPFQPTYSPRTILFTAADFNSDGALDLMQFSTNISVKAPPETASVWLSTPTLVFSVSKLNFTPQNVGTSSSPAPIALFNAGNAPLSISKIATSGSFSQTNDCPPSLAVSQGCTVNITFAPTANGPSNGSLAFSDNSGPGSQSLALTGWSGPAGFLMSATPGSSSVTAGSTAHYTLTLTSGGGFSGTVQLSCTGAPPEATCKPSKSSVTLNGSSSATLTVAVSTTAPSAAILVHPDVFSWKRSWSPTFWLFAFVALTGLLLSRKRQGVATIAASIFALMLVSCGGGGRNSTGGGTPSGTPLGNYNVTLSGASGTITQNTTIVLTVK